MPGLDWMDDPAEGGATTQESPAPAAQTPTPETPAPEAPQAGSPETQTAETSQPAPQTGGDAGTGSDQPEGTRSEAPPAGYVPISALLDEREKRKEAEKKLETAPKQLPLQVEDEPEPGTPEWVQWNAEQTHLTIVNERLNNSERFARKEHGAEKVDTVRAWTLARFETDPDFASRILADPDPYEAAIKEYDNAQRLEKFKDVKDPEYEEFLAWKAQRSGSPAPAPNGGPASPQPSPAPQGAQPQPAAAAQQDDAPPKSIIDGGVSAGGTHTVPAGPGQAFDSVFND